MVYEMRVYTLQPGKVPEFQALIEKRRAGHQQILQARGVVVHRGRPLNEVVHIWAYEDLNHRERARKAKERSPAPGVSPQSPGDDRQSV